MSNSYIMELDLRDREVEFEFFGGPDDGRIIVYTLGGCDVPFIRNVVTQTTEGVQLHLYEFKCSCFPDKNGKMVEQFGFYYCPQWTRLA